MISSCSSKRTSWVCPFAVLQMQRPLRLVQPILQGLQADFGIALMPFENCQRQMRSSCPMAPLLGAKTCWRDGGMRCAAHGLRGERLFVRLEGFVCQVFGISEKRMKTGL